MSVTWRLSVAVAAVLAVACAIAGCSGVTTSTGAGPTGAAAGGRTIVEKGSAFVPATTRVQLGETIRFSNQDNVPHHVLVGTSDLGVQQPGADVTWTAEKDGVFGMKCLIHPKMVGQITVGVGGPAGMPERPMGGGSTGGGPGMPAPPSGYNY